MQNNLPHAKTRDLANIKYHMWKGVKEIEQKFQKQYPFMNLKIVLCKKWRHTYQNKRFSTLILETL